MSTNPKTIVHFEVTIRPGKLGAKLNRETYAQINNKVTDGKHFQKKDAYQRQMGMEVDRTKTKDEFEGVKCRVFTDETGLYYTDEWCQMQQKRCLINFDLNIDFYSKLDESEFVKEIGSFKEKYPEFTEVNNLNEYDGVEGYYIMILGGYRQVYVGTSTNIKRRIMQHWSKNKEFDRLLWPPGNKGVYESRLAIDSFRALDTTQIFVYPTSSSNLEDELKTFFSDKFVINRIMGGLIETPADILNAVASTQSRNFKL